MRELAVIALLIGVMSPSYAQYDGAKSLRKEFDDCVYSSVAAQIKRDRSSEPNSVTEAAFQSCLTEEQAIAAYMFAAGIPANQSIPMIAGIKRQIKTTVRDIYANPAKYIR